MRIFYCTGNNSLFRNGHYLTEAEFWLLYYLYSGLSLHEIVRALNISLKMVSYHKRRIMRRFQLHDDKMLAEWLRNLKYSSKMVRD